MTGCATPTDATAALLVEQVRATVQTEEARFARAQSRAAALLAITGAIAGLGGGVLAGSNGGGQRLSAIGSSGPPLLHWLAVVLALIAIGSLLWSAALAIGALREAPEPASKAAELDRFVRTGALLKLEGTASHAADSIIVLLGGQLQSIRAAVDEVDRAFARATRVLGGAVGCGLALWLIMLFGVSDNKLQFPAVKRGENGSTLAVTDATLGGP